MMMGLDDNFKDQKSYYNPSNSGWIISLEAKYVNLKMPLCVKLVDLQNL